MKFNYPKNLKNFVEEETATIMNCLEEAKLLKEEIIKLCNGISPNHVSFKHALR